MKDILDALKSTPPWLYNAYADAWAGWVLGNLPENALRDRLIAWLEDRAPDYTGGLPDVLRLPFEEGTPSQEKAKAMGAWLRKNSDLYDNRYVVMYHATDPSLPILEQGLLPTSATRRRSYQSQSGFVYLANTPERAKPFGDIGNGCDSAIYAVRVRVRDLKADTDQLNNQRAVGRVVGNTLAESIIYGGGARVKGAIHSYAIRKLDFSPEKLRITHEMIRAALTDLSENIQPTTSREKPSC